MDDQKVETVKYYNQEATSYFTSLRKDEKGSYWKNEMLKFNEYLPNGKVLEIGSGIGSDAKALINLGYDYTGTDASSELLKIARRRNPSAKFIQRYAHEIESSLGEFDGFWASAVLLHIPKNEMRESLLAISSVLKKYCIGFITMKEGAYERVEKKTGRLFTYYNENEFTNVLKSVDFSVLEVGRRDTEKDNWLIYYVKKET